MANWSNRENEHLPLQRISGKDDAAIIVSVRGERRIERWAQRRHPCRASIPSTFGEDRPGRLTIPVCRSGLAGPAATSRRRLTASRTRLHSAPRAEAALPPAVPVRGPFLSRL